MAESSNGVNFEWMVVEEQRLIDICPVIRSGGRFHGDSQSQPVSHAPSVYLRSPGHTVHSSSHSESPPSHPPHPCPTHALLVSNRTPASAAYARRTQRSSSTNASRASSPPTPRRTRASMQKACIPAILFIYVLLTSTATIRTSRQVWQAARRHPRGGQSPQILPPWKRGRQRASCSTGSRLCSWRGPHGVFGRGRCRRPGQR